ncbi:MAG: hypothetical protein ABFD89_03705 [Bryobacteraceae bacterium]
MVTKRITITLMEEMLGTSPANPELYSDFIAANRPDGADPAEAESLPTLDEEIKQGMTVFTRMDGTDSPPCLWDYQLKGFFKDSCGCLDRVPDTQSSKLKAYKKVIDGLIFVKPRKIALTLPKDAKIGICERPLRAQTAQGERVALARSETVPAGTSFTFEVQMLSDAHQKLLDEWMEYGQLRGLGQWRNSGKGRFTFKYE